MSTFVRVQGPVVATAEVGLAATGGPTAAGYDVALSGRILVGGEVEQSCVLSAIRDRVADLTTEHPGIEGERSRGVAYIDVVGRLEGATVRMGRGRIALTIEAPEAKWARLHRHLAILVRRPDLRREEGRGHLRLVPDERAVDVTLPHEVVVAGNLRDLSRSGAAVEADAAPAVGDRVLLGSTRGRVIRLFEGGFAVQFARLLPLESLDGAVRL